MNFFSQVRTKIAAILNDLSSQALLWIARGIAIAAAVIYLGWVAVSWFCLYPSAIKPDQLTYRATRDLAAGQRLRPDDFEFVPSIPKGERNQVPADANPAGKYLLPPEGREQKFRPSDVSSMPILNASPGTVKYLLPLKDQPDLVPALNRNSHVMLCAGSCVVEDARVLSVLCGNATPANCFVLLELAASDAAKLDNKTQYQLIQRN
jgi:hypothetical protein